MKTRLELIEQLEYVQENIVIVQRQANRKIVDTPYYQIFGEGQKNFKHDKEIQIKALAYWIRRFNRILDELRYEY